MNTFKTNQIKLNSESVSDILRNTRTAKDKTAAQVSADLNINIKYIEALEAGDFEALPAGIYGKNFMRDYSSYLGLDPKAVIEMYEQDHVRETNSTRKDIFSQKVPKPHYFLSLPRIIRGIVIVVLIVICVLYLGFYIKNIVSPPFLEITSPTDNFTTESSSITILGKTDTKASITVNEENVLIDQTGNFSKKINLKNGMNTITITARKKYSKTNKIDKLVLVRQAP